MSFPVRHLWTCCFTSTCTQEQDSKSKWVIWGWRKLYKAQTSVPNRQQPERTSSNMTGIQRLRHSWTSIRWNKGSNISIPPAPWITIPNHTAHRMSRASQYIEEYEIYLTNWGDKFAICLNVHPTFTDWSMNSSIKQVKDIEREQLDLPAWSRPSPTRFCN